MTQLKIYKTHPDVVLPEFGTQQAACFDIAFHHSGKTEYTGYNSYNVKFTRELNKYTNHRIVLMPGDRIMVPTGLIFDIPEGYSIRIHPRSGLSFKQGLVLANLEAVIDSDYVDETYILLTNQSQNSREILNGDRIAQAELVQQIKYEIVETSEAPEQKTDRIGGLGSTGVSTILEKRGRGRPKKVA
jgi:dUTP pyrophosphatase